MPDILSVRHLSPLAIVASVVSGVTLVLRGKSLISGTAVLRAHHVVVPAAVDFKRFTDGRWVDAKEKNVAYRWSSWDVVGQHHIVGVAVLVVGIGLIIAGIVWLEWMFGAGSVARTEARDA